jgi:hypothetical protein
VAPDALLPYLSLVDGAIARAALVRGRGLRHEHGASPSRAVDVGGFAIPDGSTRSCSA